MQRNNQLPEKRIRDDGSTLAVNSIFYTIQGEGPFAGSPAVFVRLAGCNLQCPLCDTEYTNRQQMSHEDIFLGIEHALQTHSGHPRIGNVDLIVISGGEPFRQTLSPLVRRLIEHGYRVQVESNGTYFEPDFPYLHPNVTVVISPKAGAVHPKLWNRVRHVKYVATADSIDHDGLPKHALEHPNKDGLARPPIDWEGEIYLQPVDEKNTVRNNRNLTAVVQSCMVNGYRLCLQVHKIIGVD